MSIIRLFLFTAIVVFVMWFSAANHGFVTLSFSPFPWSASLPPYLLLLIGVFIGLFLGIFFSQRKIFLYKKKFKILSKKSKFN